MTDPQELEHKKIWYAPNQFEAYGEEEIKAVEKCLRSGWLAGNGPITEEFENRIAKLFGKKYGLFVNSGSSAILLALVSLNLPKGSEIITPSCTFSTTVAPIIQLGYKPVFIDVEEKMYVPNINSIIRKINSKTSCILLPNLIGSKPNYIELSKQLKLLDRKDIKVIEDSADTITYTEDSDISTTSFYASHVITAGGTGGMVMFNDVIQLKRALMIRDWGRIGNNSEDMSDRFSYNIDSIPYDFKFLYGALGYNLKCCEMSAAFGLVQLDRLDGFLSIRKQNVINYFNYLSDVKEIILPDQSLINANLLAIPFQTENRYELLNYLESNNIQTRVCFSGNITRHPAYRNYLEDFTISDKIMKDGFLLGIHQGLNQDDIKYVCNKIRKFFNYSII